MEQTGVSSFKLVYDLVHLQKSDVADSSKAGHVDDVDDDLGTLLPCGPLVWTTTTHKLGGFKKSDAIQLDFLKLFFPTLGSLTIEN